MRSGVGSPRAPKACCMEAKMAFWLSTSVPSQSKMTSFMGALMHRVRTAMQPPGLLAPQHPVDQPVGPALGAELSLQSGRVIHRVDPLEEGYRRARIVLQIAVEYEVEDARVGRAKMPVARG